MPGLTFTIGADASPLERALARSERALKRAQQQVRLNANRMAADFNRYASQVRSAAREVDGFVSSVGGPLKAGIAGATAVLGAGAAAVGGFGAAILKTGAQLEGLEAQMQVLTGSTEAGTARFEELFNIGATTPFEVTDLVAAEATLRALGANAEEALPLVMDFAGAMNTDLKSAALDVGRGMMFGAGAVETMAGRALRAQVELATGQNALKMSTDEFRQAMIDTLQDTDGIFAGGTAKLAGTISGLISNVQDEWTRFAKAVNDSGLFAAVKAGLRTALDLVSQNRASVQQFAKDVGVGLYAAIQFALDATDKLTRGWYRLQLAVNALQGLVRAFDVGIRRALSWLIEKLEYVVRVGADFLGIDQSTVDAMGEFASNLGLAGMAFEGVTNYAAGLEGAEAALAQSARSSKEIREDMDSTRRALMDIQTSMEVAFNQAQSGGSTGGAAPTAAAPSGGGGSTEMSATMKKAMKERESLEKEVQKLHQNLLEQAEEVGLNELELLELRYQREVQATAAKFDQLSTLYQGDADKQLEIEAMKLEALEALQMTHLERVGEMQAEARQQQIDQAVGMVQDVQGALSELNNAFLDIQRQNIQENEALLSNSEANLTEDQRKALEERTEKQKEAALKAYRIQQALAVASIAIDTATAIQRALAIYGPTPAAIVPIAGAVASGVATAAKVLATPPPQFHRGVAETPTERYHTGAATAPDEVNATLLRNESVVTQTGQRQLTRAMMNGANRGDDLMGGGGSMRHRHRIFGELGRDNRRAGGFVAEAQRGDRKVGRRQRVVTR